MKAIFGLNSARQRNLEQSCRRRMAEELAGPEPRKILLATLVDRRSVAGRSNSVKWSLQIGRTKPGLRDA
jgi:hypothetical protein